MSDDAGSIDGESTDAPVDDSELERVEERFTSLVEDVRNRTVQVKRELDGKAAADHTHEELHGAVERLEEDIEEIQAEVEQVGTRLDEGFENYETILEYLIETTDELEQQFNTITRGLTEMRDRLDEIADENARRSIVVQLADKANQNGIDSAKCEECGNGVNIGLLKEPECPHCKASFGDVKPKSGFFGSATLETGSPPALEGPEGETESPDLLESLDDLADGADEASEGATSEDLLASLGNGDETNEEE